MIKVKETHWVLRDEKSQLLLGTRRANRQQPALSSSVISSDSMHIGILAAAAHAAANNSPFTIFYNPRLPDETLASSPSLTSSPAAAAALSDGSPSPLSLFIPSPFTLSPSLPFAFSHRVFLSRSQPPRHDFSLFF
ncbi:hypothetical protein Vadar_012458 [Vaccinium darrowii]|uniref:Uncharacterized protein n=1 Tax=Vaccinium darrowii TaxID=229202 RepID=A0ACB7YDL5_9ERIC|nr:hypothetical protein Vadar_012458 [Vaccinium darrowii]